MDLQERCWFSEGPHVDRSRGPRNCLRKAQEPGLSMMGLAEYADRDFMAVVTFR